MGIIPAQSAGAMTMSSSEIASLVESRHDNVKRTVERLAKRGVIQLPPLEEVANHLGQLVGEYRIGKRDSYVIVAQLSPEFTARLVDRWQELEDAQRAATALSLEDDTQALLSVLADMQADLRGAASKNVEQIISAVVRYSREHIKAPSDRFFADMRGAAANRIIREAEMKASFDQMTAAVTELIRRAKHVADDRFIWTEWYDCDRLYSEWFPERHIPRRGLLSGVVSRALDRHCKATRKFHHMEHRIVGGKGVNWWHKDSVFAWLEAGGRHLIATHLDRYSQEPRRPVLALVN